LMINQTGFAVKIDNRLGFVPKACVEYLAKTD